MPSGVYKRTQADRDRMAALGKARKGVPKTEKFMKAVSKDRIPQQVKVLVKTLMDSGWTWKQIQALHEVLPRGNSALQSITKEFEADSKALADYRENKDLVIEKAAYKDFLLLGKLRDQVDEKGIETATFAELAKLIQAMVPAFGNKFDKVRLLKDQSTENVAVIHRHIKEMKKRDAEKRGNDLPGDRATDKGRKSALLLGNA